MTDDQTTVPSRQPDGEFWCFTTWVNKATSWIGGMNALCLDAKDRRCRNGADMMRARDESAFPVRFWYGEGGETPAQQRRSQRLTRRAINLHYPWRKAAGL